MLLSRSLKTCPIVSGNISLITYHGSFYDDRDIVEVKHILLRRLITYHGSLYDDHDSMRYRRSRTSLVTSTNATRGRVLSEVVIGSAEGNITPLAGGSSPEGSDRERAEGNIGCHKPLMELGGNRCVEGGLLDGFRPTKKVGLKDCGNGEKVLPRVRAVVTMWYSIGQCQREAHSQHTPKT
jgi:hypothetical protein